MFSLLSDLPCVMDIQEHNSTVKLPSLLDEIGVPTREMWGIVRVSRRYLKPMTNEALVMAMKPALADAKIAHVFLDAETQIFIVWQGDPIKTYKQLRGFIITTLTQCDPTTPPTAIVGYINPQKHGRALKEVLRIAAQTSKNSKAQTKLIEELIDSEDVFDFSDTEANLLGDTASSLIATAEQQNLEGSVRSLDNNSYLPRDRTATSLKPD